MVIKRYSGISYETTNVSVSILFLWFPNKSYPSTPYSLTPSYFTYHLANASNTNSLARTEDTTTNTHTIFIKRFLACQSECARERLLSLVIYYIGRVYIFPVVVVIKNHHHSASYPSCAWQSIKRTLIPHVGINLPYLGWEI